MDRDPLARLLLVKDLNRDSLNYYTLRRLEHLRCTLLSKLASLKIGALSPSAKFLDFMAS
ncbi:MAG: hypothetical protein Q8M86_09695 [Syntrophales bacterium]|nr:hypothetical protein [Syntrophales bacterium]